MAGKWDETSDGDRSAIEALAERTYGEVDDELTTLANTYGKPIAQVDGLWYVVAPDDALMLVGGRLGLRDLDVVGDVMLDDRPAVIDERQPAQTSDVEQWVDVMLIDELGLAPVLGEIDSMRVQLPTRASWHSPRAFADDTPVTCVTACTDAGVARGGRR